MRPGAGKGKGSSFERWVARRLSLWLTGGKDGTQLVRAVLSGGWKDRGKRQAGDLAANGPFGERFRQDFIVECKHRRGDLLWGLYTKAGGESVQGWWMKLEDEGRANSLIPLLIFKQNRRPVLVATSFGFASALLHALAEAGRSAGPFLEHMADRRRGEAGRIIRFTVLPLSDLLHIDPTTIYRLVGRGR